MLCLGYISSYKEKKKKRVHLEEHRHSNVISETERIEFRYWTVRGNGEPVKFSVCYRVFIEGGWTAIRRCDDSHEEKAQFARRGLRGHCHIFSAQGGELVETEVMLGPGTPADHLTEVLEDFNKNHNEMRLLYLQAVEKAKRQRTKR